MDKSITDIIFDLDGTLIDSAPSILECFKSVLILNNIEPLRPLSLDLIGPPLAQTLSHLTGIHELVALNKLAEDFKKYYDFGGYKSTVPFLGITELLEECCFCGFGLHVATNKRLLPTNLILDHLGWRKHFKSIYTIDSSSPPFQNKATMLSALLKNEKIVLNSAVYIGDRLEDSQSAMQNSLRFLGATWGYQDEKLLSNEAITSCHTIKQFSQYLNS